MQLSARTIVLVVVQEMPYTACSLPRQARRAPHRVVQAAPRPPTCPGPSSSTARATPRSAPRRHPAPAPQGLALAAGPAHCRRPQSAGAPATPTARPPGLRPAAASAAERTRGTLHSSTCLPVVRHQRPKTGHALNGQPCQGTGCHTPRRLCKLATLIGINSLVFMPVDSMAATF